MKISDIRRMQQLAGIRITEDFDPGVFTMKNPLKSISSDERMFEVVYELYDFLYEPSEVVVKNVPIDKIICTEQTLDPKNVRNPRNSNPPLLIEYRGDFYVADGNHRVVHAALMDKKYIKSNVVVIPPKMELYTFTLNDGRMQHYYGAENEDEVWEILRGLEAGKYMVTSILDQEGKEIYWD